jgi:hypothetical protein
MSSKKADPGEEEGRPSAVVARTRQLFGGRTHWGDGRGRHCNYYPNVPLSLLVDDHADYARIACTNRLGD